jgi:hypothetical protein
MILEQVPLRILNTRILMGEGGVVHIHISVFYLTNFFGNQLFLKISCF